MSRTADVSVLAETGKKLLGLASAAMEADDLEALQLDMDSIGVLLVEFQASQLAHDQVQWVLWHLLEHVMQDLFEAAEDVGDDKIDEFYEAFDDYVEAFQEKLTSRAKIACPRLDALLASYWAESQDCGRGDDDEPEEPATAGSPDDAEEEPEDEEE